MSKIKKIQYDSAQMALAVKAVEEGMPKSRAAKIFCVPRSTLLDKVSGRTPLESKAGKNPYLNLQEEAILVNWIKRANLRGLPPHRNDILNSVQNILLNSPDRDTPFKYNRPGVAWFRLFLKRHPDVSVRNSRKLSEHESSEEISEDHIHSWYSELKGNISKLGAEDIFQDPTRIFYSSETNFLLNPTTGKVMGLRRWRNVYMMDPEPKKSTLTLLATVSAKGDMVSPTVIYPYTEVPKDVIRNMPGDFYFTTSETGWMESGSFYKFLSNSFEQFLSKKHIVRPVILFIDGSKTHLTLQTSNYCEDNGIILYLLPQKMTRSLHIATVGPFSSLKTYWKEQVESFRQNNQNVLIQIKHVAPILKNVLCRINEGSIVNGFLSTGLYPMDPERVDVLKFLDTKNAQNNEDDDVDFVDSEDQEAPVVYSPHADQQQRYSKALEVIESELGPQGTVGCRVRSGLSSDTLYDLYSRIYMKAKGLECVKSDVFETREFLQGIPFH